MSKHCIFAFSFVNFFVYKQTILEGKFQSKQSSKYRVFTAYGNHIFCSNYEWKQNESVYLCIPALWDLEMALAFAFPESLPALPPAIFFRV